MTKTGILAIFGLLAALAGGLEAGYRIGWHDRDNKAVREFDKSYMKGFQACQDQF